MRKKTQENVIDIMVDSIKSQTIFEGHCRNTALYSWYTRISNIMIVNIKSKVTKTNFIFSN